MSSSTDGLETGSSLAAKDRSDRNFWVRNLVSLAPIVLSLHLRPSTKFGNKRSSSSTQCLSRLRYAYRCLCPLHSSRPNIHNGRHGHVVLYRTITRHCVYMPSDSTTASSLDMAMVPWYQSAVYYTSSSYKQGESRPTASTQIIAQREEDASFLGRRIESERLLSFEYMRARWDQG